MKKIPFEFKALGALLIVSLALTYMWRDASPKEIDKDNLVSIKSTGEYYEEYADTLDLIEVIDSHELTIEELGNRNGKLIIERVIGVVEDAETGAGSVLNGDKNFYYISYDKVDGIHNGDIICTYMIYEPYSNYEDDIIYRFDSIIDCKGGK